MWPISLDLVLWSRTSNIWYHLLIRFFFSCYLFSGPFETSNLFTIHWKKNQNTLIYFELESNLKTKKNNLKQLTSVQSSPVPVNDVQLYSYVHLIVSFDINFSIVILLSCLFTCMRHPYKPDKFCLLYFNCYIFYRTIQWNFTITTPIKNRHSGWFWKSLSYPLYS